MAPVIFRLLFVEGHIPGQKYDLIKDELVIGRDESADLQIPSPFRFTKTCLPAHFWV